MYSLANSISRVSKIVFTPSMLFMVGVMIVNAGNYVYNLMLGRKLSPAFFSEAGLLLTLLLVFAFLAMTFQIVSAKFSIEFEGMKLTYFKRWINRIGMNVGVLLSAVMLVFNESLTAFFHLTDRWTMVVFSLALPFYFVMSNYRGFYQGTQQFTSLTVSYQVEMWVRLVVTFMALQVLRVNPSFIVAGSIVFSIVAGHVVLKPKAHFVGRVPRFEGSGLVIRFFMLTAGYECAQILINYSDILLVKHYFDATVAGYYTSMALIGRMIYFVTWMLVMILIPKVINLKKQGQPYRQVLMQYFFLIAGFSAVLIASALFFPKLIVTMLFGEAYLPVAHLLWMYALATTLFALANLFVYYYLSLDYRKPVYVAIIAGVIQVGLFLQFHESLAQILTVQIANMSVLLAFMIHRFVKTKI
ncbi:MAG: sugar isomerase [Bacteroidota bacterium]